MENLPREDWENYHALKEALNKRYTPKLKCLNYQLELGRREQGAGESLEDFAKALRKLAEIAYQDEADLDKSEERNQACLIACMGGVRDPVARVHL